MTVGSVRTAEFSQLKGHVLLDGAFLRGPSSFLRGPSIVRPVVRAFALLSGLAGRCGRFGR